LSQKYVAAAVDVSRQSLNAIETARATPNVLLALKLARVLGSDVETLFGADVREEREAVLGASVRKSETRVLLGVVRERWVAHPLYAEQGAPEPYAADGFLRGLRGSAGKTVRVELARPAGELADTLFVGGCAPGLGVLMDRLNGGHGRYRWLMQANASALRSWARGHTHLTGIHLPDDAPQRLARLVARHLPTERGALHAFASWEAGLVVAAGNPKRVRDVRALRKLRVALREEGSGARVELARLMREQGLELATLLPRSIATGSHFAVAQAVQLGAADVGFSIRAVALAFGLDFVPLIQERFDLAIPDDLAHDTRTVRLLDMLSSRAFRRELNELGYDATHAGDKITDISAP
jgi:putative molybdopterin biosynthesis protein